MKALTQQEITAVMAVAEEPLRTAILVAFRHGMRASEVCQLLWSDVDLESKSILVRRLKNSLTTRQPLSQQEVDALSSLPKDSERVFPISRWTLGRDFKEACLAAGVSPSKAHFHSVKHSLGYALVAANVNLAVIKQALGHRSISSTIIYSVPSEEQVGQLVSQALGA